MRQAKRRSVESHGLTVGRVSRAPTISALTGRLNRLVGSTFLPRGRTAIEIESALAPLTCSTNDPPTAHLRILLDSIAIGCSLWLCGLPNCPFCTTSTQPSDDKADGVEAGFGAFLNWRSGPGTFLGARSVGEGSLLPRRCAQCPRQPARWGQEPPVRSRRQLRAIRRCPGRSFAFKSAILERVTTAAGSPRNSLASRQQHCWRAALAHLNHRDITRTP